VLLSGGLDSSAVAAAAVTAARRSGAALPRALSAAYPADPRLDESHYFSAAANRLGIPLHVISPAPRPLQSVEAEVKRHDGPPVGSFASNFRALLLEGRRVGCRTLLDGHDGDSLCGRTNRVVPALLRQRAFATAWRYVANRRARAQSSWPRLLAHQAIELCGPTATDKLQALRRTLETTDASQPGWASFDVRGFAPALLGPTTRNWTEAQCDVVGPWTWLTLEFLEREALTAGVDLLHPFFDQDVVELAMAMPPEVKVTGGQPKGILRAAFRLEWPRLVLERTSKAAFNDFFCASCPPSDVRDAVARLGLDSSWVDGARLEQTMRNGASYGHLVLLVSLLQVAYLLESIG
jgi:asparagine synthetase B (glutamine-hydrolysing)